MMSIIMDEQTYQKLFCYQSSAKSIVKTNNHNNSEMCNLNNNKQKSGDEFCEKIKKNDLLSMNNNGCTIQLRTNRNGLTDAGQIRRNNGELNRNSMGCILSSNVSSIYGPIPYS